jgi:hypothetical protein
LAAPKPCSEPSGEKGWDEEQSPGGWKLEGTLFKLQAGTMNDGTEPFDETSSLHFISTEMNA